MNILVTGGAGYVGSHVCKALAHAGMVPVTYDNLCLGHRWAVQWGPLEEGDIADGPRLRAVLPRYKIQGVIHCAAFSLVGESAADPEKYYRNNALGTLSLLEAMRDTGIACIVFSGSSAVYGQPEQVPIAEDAPLRPLSAYGASKLASERMLQDFGTAHALRWASLRYFNAAGADPEAEIGEDHSPETHLIPLALDVALGRQPEIMIFGNDYATPDGTCIRDYVHVSDLARAHVLALRRLLEGAEGGAVNLGMGKGASVAEIIAVARSVTGAAIPVRYGPRRAGDPPMLVSDSRRAAGLLRWQPERDMTAIMEDAWRWHRRHFA